MLRDSKKLPYLEDRAPGLGRKVVNNHGDCKSPNKGVGPLPNGHSWLINGVILTTKWDDPPSRFPGVQRRHVLFNKLFRS